MRLVEIIGRGGGPLSRYMLDKVIAQLWHDAIYSDESTVEMYAQTEGIEGDRQKILRSRGFRQWFRDTFEDRVWETYYQIERRIQDNKILVYREITAPPGWEPDPQRHPGQFWSWDEGAAEAHWGNFANGEVKWIIQAEAPIDQIAWVDTLAKNASFDYESEREIALKPNGRVQMTNWYRR